MANEKRLIDANTFTWSMALNDNDEPFLYVTADYIDECPTVDAVEVVHDYKPGDVCFYGFHNENKSLALIEVVKILNDVRGVAEVRFLKVFVDDTGNGMFNYLLRSGKTMNASLKYLKNVTPNYGAKVDGERRSDNG